MKQIKSVFLFAFSAIISTAAAQTTAPTTKPLNAPTASNLEAHEWSVFIIDGATGQLNPEGIITATLPAFVTDHRYGSAGAPAPEAAPVVGRRIFVRKAAGPKPQTLQTESDEPSPVGIIRLIGSADSKVDVTIQAKGGTFLGSWPKAQDRANELLWRDLTVSDTTDTPLSGVSADHWFTTLRTGKSAIVSADHAGTEKFLAYDLEMPYASPVKAKEQPDFSVEISNTTNTTLHDLTLYQGGEHDSIRTISVGDLLPVLKSTTTRPATQATTRPATQSSKIPEKGKARLGATVTSVTDMKVLANSLGYTDNTGLIVQQVASGSPAQDVLKEGDIISKIAGQELNSVDDFRKAIADLPAGSALQLDILRDRKTMTVNIVLDQFTRSESAASTAPIVGAHKVQLQTAPTTQPADLIEAWKPIINNAGVDPADAEVIERLIAKYAFDPHRLTAVYRMDDAEYDRLLPIEIVPQPAKITRFGLVIIINADPTGGTAIDDLIKQLGDEDWSKRDAAYHTLAGMGPAAKDKLTTASKSPDLEIAWRAERLLALSPQGAK